VRDVGERAAVDEHGLFSSVCTRLGISASLSSTVHGAVALEVARQHGFLSRV